MSDLTNIRNINSETALPCHFDAPLEEPVVADGIPRKGHVSGGIETGGIVGGKRGDGLGPVCG